MLQVQAQKNGVTVSRLANDLIRQKLAFRHIRE
jgi:hypothetical protein